MFPQLPALTLPRKKLFGDNFSSLFLSNRVQGLQKFINSVLANDTLRHSKPVRDFFCLDEPPTYLDNIEECRAIFEAQEDTISNLKLQLRAKDETMALLQKELDAEAVKNEALSAAIRLDRLFYLSTNICLFRVIFLILSKFFLPDFHMKIA